ncbi:hypothetical protein L1987_62458 [Smallanthus sonchifolius]|uniref:Uncharacterized protein n=1 Tax=Smallanthus sonchifolius TaxID=185202 RepID=A0ACB9CAN9_9ASTR|nr:hypothetical protein L1987_62458 [Smallanthus sonchifolius]
MASIGTTCSSGLILRRKELTNNGGSMLQFNGLRAMEANQVVAPSGFNPSCMARISTDCKPRLVRVISPVFLLRKII